MTKKISTLLAIAALQATLLSAQEKPDTMWFQFEDRFTENEVIGLTNVDSIEFTNTRLKL